MKRKNTFSAAFTLIELLVVITIIGILASVALPVFNSVQTRGAQTKALAQAKQIGLALKILAGDNDGVYPRLNVPSACTTDPAYANDAFATLFPTYTQSEAIFGNKLSKWQTSPPDGVYDNPYVVAHPQTLKAGENVYGYMKGLTDANNPASPIVFDGPTSKNGNYSKIQSEKGGVWSGTKAIVIRLDNSGALENLDSNNNYTVQGYDPAAGTTTKVNILDTGANTSLGKDCTLLLPQ